jgi:hypothetical protein
MMKWIVRIQRRLLIGLVLSWGDSFAQEPPAFRDKEFTNSTIVNNKSNVCDRYRQLDWGQIDLPDALRGLHLSVVLIDYQEPITQALFGLRNGVIPTSHNNDGPLFVVLLDELARRAGFQWRNSYGVVVPLPANSSYTYSDLLLWEVETYDIAMGRWDRTVARIANGISFPEGFLDSSLILIQNKQNSSQPVVFGFFLPFQAGVWALILIVLIMTGLIYFIMERIDMHSDAQPLETEPGQTVYLSFIVLTGHNEFKPRTVSARMVIFSLTFWALITSAAYTANLASFLVTRHESDFGFHEVRDAVAMRIPICIQGGVALDEYISERYPRAVLIRKSSSSQVFEALRNNHCSLAVVSRNEYETAERNEKLNKNCWLSWSGRVERFVPSGMAVAVDTGTYCTSLISHVLDFHLLEMKLEGVLDRAWENYLSNVGNDNSIHSRRSARQYQSFIARHERNFHFSFYILCNSSCHCVCSVFSSQAI